MGKVRDFDGRWVGGPKDSQHGPFWRMSTSFGTRGQALYLPTVCVNK